MKQERQTAKIKPGLEWKWLNKLAKTSYYKEKTREKPGHILGREKEHETRNPLPYNKIIALKKYK